MYNGNIYTDKSILNITIWTFFLDVKQHLCLVFRHSLDGVDGHSQVRLISQYTTQAGYDMGCLISENQTGFKTQADLNILALAPLFNFLLNILLT